MAEGVALVANGLAAFRTRNPDIKVNILDNVATGDGIYFAGLRTDIVIGAGASVSNFRVGVVSSG